MIDAQRDCDIGTTAQVVDEALPTFGLGVGEMRSAAGLRRFHPHALDDAPRRAA
jgi:hypothetical protein